MQRVVKPTTRKGKKVLLAREPQLIEGPKQAIFVYGRKSSENIKKVMEDLCLLKKPAATSLKRNKKLFILPFEDSVPLENLSRRKLCSLFFFSSHTKKRPNNLVIGRTFDNAVLDMFEFGVDDFKSLSDFENEKIMSGLKPCLSFNGPEWDQIPTLQRLKSLFVDCFYREKYEAVHLQGVEHVLSFTVLPIPGQTVEDKELNLKDVKILFRSYKIHLKKSGCQTPRIELEEIGPSLDFSLRRNKIASTDLFKMACKQPKELKAKTNNNITKDNLGTTYGRVHIGDQMTNIRKMQTRKIKGLRRTPLEKKEFRMKKKRAASNDRQSQSKRVKTSAEQ